MNSTQLAAHPFGVNNHSPRGQRVSLFLTRHESVQQVLPHPVMPGESRPLYQSFEIVAASKQSEQSQTEKYEQCRDGIWSNVPREGNANNDGEDIKEKQAEINLVKIHDQRMTA